MCISSLLVMMDNIPKINKPWQPHVQEYGHIQYSLCMIHMIKK